MFSEVYQKMTQLKKNDHSSNFQDLDDMLGNTLNLWDYENTFQGF